MLTGTGNQSRDQSDQHCGRSRQNPQVRHAGQSECFVQPPIPQRLLGGLDSHILQITEHTKHLC